MAVERQFVVKLLADPTQLIKDFQTVRGEAEKTFGITNAKLQQLLPTFKILTTAAAGVFTGLVAGAGLAVRAAAEQEAQQQRLRQILLTTGKATASQVDALNDQADALERVGVVSGGNITTLQSQLATFDLQADTIARLTPAILDYVVAEKGAAATAEDFKSMTNGLAQALNGQFGALTRVGFVLDDATKAMIENGTESERSAALVEVLNSTYKGFNASLRETTEGRMQAFRNSLAKLQTDIGNALLPVFETFVKVLGTFADLAARNSTAVGVLGGVLGVLSGTVLALAGYLKIAAFQKRLMNDEFTRGLVTMRNAEGQITRTGVAVRGLGSAFTGLLAAQAVASILNEVTGANRRLEDQVKKTSAALNGFESGTSTAEDAIREFISVAQADLRKLDPIGAIGGVVKFEQFGRQFQLLSDDIKLDIEVLDRTFRKFLDSDPTKAAQIVDALEAQLKVTDPSSRSFTDLKDAIDRYRGAVNLTVAAQGRLNDEIEQTPIIVRTTSQALLQSALARGKVTDASTRYITNEKQFNDIAKKVADSLKSGASATDKIADAKKKLDSASRSLTSAQIGERNSIERVTDAQKALDKANESVVQAKEKLSQAIRGFGLESKKGAAASRSLTMAQRDLSKANTEVKDAQDRVIQAEKKLAELRSKAADPNEVTNAEFGLEKSKLDVEEATLAVQEAEEALAKTLKDPEASPIDKRRAELALVSAKFGLRDALLDVGEAERKVIEVRATGATPDELAEAERELSDAKTAVEDAIFNQTKAVEDLTTAQEEYRKIVEGIREGDEEYVELSKEIVTAEENQAAASRDLRDAREGAATATDNLRTAEEELRASRKELRVARTGAPGRAFGGPVTSGRPYIVGERGPEMFVPSGSGNIVPNNKLGGGGVNVQVVVNAGMGTSGTQVGQEIVDLLRAYTKVSGPLSQYVEV